jgi:nitrate reductase NapD
MAIQPQLDRRAFISGRITDPDALIAPPDAEIASVLVQARPERLGEVEAAIVALEGCEIHARDMRGKLVVVIEASSAGAVGATLNQIALLPDVFSAALVFHATDAAAAESN